MSDDLMKYIVLNMAIQFLMTLEHLPLLHRVSNPAIPLDAQYGVSERKSYLSTRNALDYSCPRWEVT